MPVFRFHPVYTDKGQHCAIKNITFKTVTSTGFYTADQQFQFFFQTFRGFYLYDCRYFFQFQNSDYFADFHEENFNFPNTMNKKKATWKIRHLQGSCHLMLHAKENLSFINHI